MAQRFLIQPPEQFDFDHRQLGQAWKAWKQRFLTVLDAADYDTASEKKKISLLLHAMGPDGIELYNTFQFSDDESSSESSSESSGGSHETEGIESSGEGIASSGQTTFQNVLQKFTDHFLPRVNVTFERHLFFIRDQMEGESADRYVTTLRKLAKTCEFGTLFDSLIRDRFVCGLKDSFLKERLLRTTDLTLQKVIDSARASEVAREQRKVIDSPVERVEAATVAVTSSKSEQSDSQVESTGRCSRCGYKHGTRRCPASGKSCHYCKGIGHFTSMCRTKKAAKVQTVSRQTELGEDVVYAVGPQSLNETQNAKKDTTQTFHVDALDGKGLTWQFEMLTEGQRVDYKLDTGAQVNLLPYDIYQRLYPRPPLHPTRSRLFAYGAESPIAVRGQCVCGV